MLKRILLAGGSGGLVVGFLLSAVQSFQVVRLILEAETYESGRPAQTSHAEEGVNAHGLGYAHDHEAWSPEDRVERTFWTVIANVGTTAPRSVSA